MRKTTMVALLAFASSCFHPTSDPSTPAGTAPAYMLGNFSDDYGEGHTVSPTEWFQHPGNRFRIVKWEPSRTYLIAQNDSTNRGGRGKWTRVDWVKLDGMPPYEWAFCFSAFDAPSRAAAESVSVAHPETPRTGCNNFPYTRMRRAAP